MTILPTAPDCAKHGDSYLFGRYKEAIHTPNIDAPGLLSRWKLKRWHYQSIATPQHFFAFALVDLGYAAKVFAYLIDRSRPTEKHEYTSLSPLGRGLQFADSSVQGQTAWQDGANRLAVSYQNGWQMTIDLRLGKVRVHGQVSVQNDEALALLFRLPTGHPAYTHKAAGLRVHGSLFVNDTAIDLREAVASLDWTRSVALRETRWLWCSLQGYRGAVRVGLNLSALVYDDAAGDSQENALWIDGRVYPLGGVTFSLPDNPRTEPWQIRSKDPHRSEINLVFTPYGTREEQLNLGLVMSRFIQPYGSYQGTVFSTESGHPPLSVDGLFGVVETHHCLW
ncbi:MAG: DUF2804 domain-containing protein [Myxococcales bacterium]|nr:DUF2804 domain-containing protein [Myxococcales bacterium]